MIKNTFQFTSYTENYGDDNGYHKNEMVAFDGHSNVLTKQLALAPSNGRACALLEVQGPTPEVVMVGRIFVFPTMLKRIYILSTTRRYKCMEMYNFRIWAMQYALNMFYTDC